MDKENNGVLHDLQSMLLVAERISEVGKSSLESKKPAIRKLADFATQFKYVSQLKSRLYSCTTTPF